MPKFKVTITYEVEVVNPREKPMPPTPNEVLETVRLRFPDLGYGANPFWQVVPGSERAKVKRKW